MASIHDHNTIPARTSGTLTPGKAVKMLRELHEMSQSELARASGLSQPIISAIERGTTNVGIERAKRLAKALNVHPSAIAFADVPS
jgi:transcriptional regulator with XRE-family HTH domain